jgi:hypothetical protein
MNRLIAKTATYLITAVITYATVVIAVNTLNTHECDLCKRKINKKEKCRTTGCKNCYKWNTNLATSCSGLRSNPSLVGSRFEDYDFVDDVDDYKK